MQILHTAPAVPAIFDHSGDPGAVPRRGPHATAAVCAVTGQRCGAARDGGLPAHGVCRRAPTRPGSTVPPGSCDFDCSATSYLVHAPGRTVASRSNATP